MAAATNPNPNPSSSSDLSDGPVLNLINKRLRALRKKQNRISQMESSLSLGKTLNSEQLETLASKPSLLGAIEELEKLRQLLPPALAQELHQNKPTENNTENNNENRDDNNNDDDAGVIEDVLNLMYFGSMFDVKSQSDYVGMMYRKSHERGCCLTYDYVKDDDVEGDLLGERDLDLISMLGEAMIARPVDSSLSHKKALQKCVEHAKRWVEKSEEQIVADSDVTYATLREKLNKIMASDYFTTTPEMKPSVEMAAVAENFQSFQVTSNGSVEPINVPIGVEDSTIEYENTEQDENSKQHEAYDGQFGHVEELQQDTSEVENSVGVNVEVEADLQQNEMQNSQEPENREQVNAPRRQHRGGRGGGYKGYNNGRGGRGRGGYQNGYSQNYEQTDKYYPRYNTNFRGRGGRGGARGNYNPTAEGGRVPFDA